MKAAELRKQSDEQLNQLLRETEKQLFTLRFQSATDRLETPSEIKKAKKDIARIHTVLRQRELEKLKAQPDARLNELLNAAIGGESEPGKPFVGKRKALRQQYRIEGLLMERELAAAKAANKAKATAGKGGK